MHLHELNESGNRHTQNRYRRTQRLAVTPTLIGGSTVQNLVPQSVELSEELLDAM